MVPLMFSLCILKRDRNVWLTIKLKSEKEGGEVEPQAVALLVMLVGGGGKNAQRTPYSFK